MKNRQYLLMILDGVGINEGEFGNAYAQAKKPNLDRILSQYKSSRIRTSGEDVGLPEGQMGNSEVGHTNIGSGRIVYQELTRISKEIKEGSLFENPALVEAMRNTKDNDRALHIMGLVSDGGVHSHQEHLYALLEMAKDKGLKKVFVHAFLDGRDTLPDTAAKFIKKLEDKIKEIGVGKIATVAGRYYAMDRDNRWDRVKLAYDAMVDGEGEKIKSISGYLKTSYDQKVYDEFIKPAVVTNESGEAIAKVSEGDSLIFFNFRPDRARQITRAFVDNGFDGFKRDKVKNLHYVTMTEYDSSIEDVHVAYKPQVISNTFGEYIAGLGYTQLRTAETEKYAHVTFFFNGGKEEQNIGEDRLLVESPKVATYDLQPEMSAREVTNGVIDAIDAKKYDVIVVNFANGDMVGHTGKMAEAIKAVEVLDECVGKIISKLESIDGEAIITADHGNCEYMINPETNDIITSHTTFDVLLTVVSKRINSVKDGRLCDIAPSMLALMGESVPKEMTGESLISLKKGK